MPKNPTRLPAPLSERLASTSSALLVRRGKEVDVAVAGIPFLQATSKDLPYSIETIEQRKDQLDVEPEPGEQSLSNWWRRSQESFHEGAGNLYQEARSEANPLAGFYDSRGVDVWTRGQFSLLRRMDEVTAPGGGHGRIRTYATNGTRVNLCTNPNFETSTAGWVAQADPDVPGSAPLLAQDATRVYDGTYSMKVTWQGDGGGGFPPLLTVPHAAFTVGRTYTVSMKVYVPSGSTGPILVVQSAFGGSTTLRDQWVTISHTFTATSTTSTLALWPNGTATAGLIFNVDDILIEEATSVQPYFDGNSTSAAWDGTPNLSTSTLTLDGADVGVTAVTSTALRYGDGPATLADLHAPAGKAVVDGFISGLYFYTLCSDGTLYEGLTSSPGTASNWSTAAGMTRMDFGKHRLWVIGGRSIYQPDLTLASGSAQSSTFVHPNRGWQYTCLAEGPQAMYFGGHDGRSSSIQAIALTSDGGVPTLTGAQVTTTLPDGELIQEIAVLAGQYVGIGTNQGFRVGVIDATSITYGPILFAPEGLRRCTAIAVQDRFFLVSFSTTDGGAEVWKVDASTDLGDGTFPYARDVELDTGSATSLAVWGEANNQIVATDTLGRVWEQSSTELVELGYLHTGRIRFRTNERKLFKYLEFDTDPLDGSIQVVGYTETDSQFDIQTISQQGEAGTSPIPFTSILGPQRHVSLKLTLTRDADDATAGPVVRSYLVRALPTAKPQRLITVPLLCYDREQGHSGYRYGYEGYASERLAALQAIEDVGDTVIFQDFGLLDGTGQTVVVEKIRFVQTAVNTKASHSGRGGILILQLRTVTA